MTHRPRLLALVALACSAGAWAQTADRPYYVGIKQEFAHESNLLDSPAGTEVHDTVSTTTLLGGLNIPFGRQHAYANASMFHQSFKDLGQRNTDGYDLGAGLDWSTVERFSGSLSLTSYRHQAGGFVGGIVAVGPNNIERSTAANAGFHLGADTALSFDASLGHRQVGFSAPEYAAQAYRQDSGSLGLTYRPSGILRLGTGVAVQRTSYVSVAGQPADKSKRNDVYVSANWVPTGASTVIARINFGKTEYDIATFNNLSGVTGSLAWAWKPTGLLVLSTTLVRDTGQNAGFLQSANTAAQTATNFSQLTNSLQVHADYDLTGKIKVDAGLAYARRNFPVAVNAISGNDNTTTLSLGAHWAALRTVNLGCTVSRETRTATGTASTPYDNNHVGCFGQFTID